MPVLVISNFDDDLIKKMNELEWRHHFFHYKSMGNVLDAQGQLTP